MPAARPLTLTPRGDRLCADPGARPDHRTSSRYRLCRPPSLFEPRAPARRDGAARLSAGLISSRHAGRRR